MIGETTGWLGASSYLQQVEGQPNGAPPPVDLPLELKNGEFVRTQIIAGFTTACHDISDGGLIVALAEMALAGNIGAEIEPNDLSLPLHAWLFGEDQARYILTTANPEVMLEAAEAAGVVASMIGHTGGSSLKVSGSHTISISELRDAHERWLPEYMATP